MLTDPDACRRWSPVPFDLDGAHAGRLAAGSRMRVSGSLVGKRVGFDVEVHEAGDGRLALSAHGPVAFDVAYEARAAGGGSEVCASVSVRSGGGLFGRVAESGHRRPAAGRRPRRRRRPHRRLRDRLNPHPKEPTMTALTLDTAPPTRPPSPLAPLTRRYGDGESAVDALRGVSLEVPAGQFTAVMGPSGSGKSTLMHLLAGLDRPTSGLGARRRRGDLRRWPTARSRKLRRKHIGFVFQSFNLLPTLTAEENVTLPLAIARDEAGRAPRSTRCSSGSA